MFATMFCGVLNVFSGRLDYCNWGHNPPLLVRKTGAGRESLPAGGPPLGIDVGMHCKSGSVTLGIGDLLFLYTDGVTEAENPEQVQFGKDRLSAAIDEDGARLGAGDRQKRDETRERVRRWRSSIG